jgi:hypothetical protein
MIFETAHHKFCTYTGQCKLRSRPQRDLKIRCKFSSGRDLTYPKRCGVCNRQNVYINYQNSYTHIYTVYSRKGFDIEITN